MPTQHNDTKTYYQQRMQQLGVTPEINTVKLWQSTTFDSKHNGENILVPFPVFTEGPKGIDILVYDLHRCKVRITKDASRSGVAIKAKGADYKITRYENPIVKDNGDVLKYYMPRGEKTYPFFPPLLLSDFDSKATIPVLYITEGYFKAFKMCMAGIHCVGLPSITCMRDKETDKLHADILELIHTCKVERVVWLTDGDCRNITTKEISEEKDLYKRPNQFFNTVSTFNELLSSVECGKFFAHINTDDLQFVDDQGNIKTQGPKGADDLLCQFPDSTEHIVKDFRDFSKVGQQGVFTGPYVVKINISFNLIRIRSYFFLDNVDKFYQYHSEKRPDLKRAGKFKYNGTIYSYDEKDGTCKVEVPGAASLYFRVGDDYYKFVERVDKYGVLKIEYQRRSKATIVDDHGKEFCKHIPKYESFCVMPEHQNYQRVIHSNFNKYQPFKHVAEEGEYQLSIDFVKHIFGTDPVPYIDDAGQPATLPRYEIGLDYITLLYKIPQQILPILCLASGERQTGKTTFVQWLAAIFLGNVAIVGNADLASDFNGHWSDKLIVACDEAKIDKDVVLEKVKMLSTASEMMMNQKGRDQIQMDIFLKFILLTNNEDNFINIPEEEIRFWILTVPTIKSKNVSLLKDLIEEIPAFLHYLNSRQMATKYKERHWFDTHLLQTEALRKIKANSKPSLEKRITAELAELFSYVDQDTIQIPTKGLTDMLKGVDKNYLIQTLKKMGYTQHRTGRGKYPKLGEGNLTAEIGQNADHGIIVNWMAFNTTYYEFNRSAFTDVPAVKTDQPQTIDYLPF